MGLGFGIRRIFLLGLSAVAAAAILGSDLPLSAQTPLADSGDMINFPSITEHEVSQLHDGITLAKWMDARGKPEGWVKPQERNPEITDPPRLECLSLLRTEELPSGTKITQAVYFYPPPVPSTVVFPTASSQGLINSCVLGMIRIEAEAPTPEIGHALDQATRQQLAMQYGESIGTKRVPFWGRSYDRDAARWIHNAEIVSGYAAESRLKYDASGQIVHGFVAFVTARLPRAKKLEDEACCEIKAYRYRPLANAQFHRAIALAGMDSGLSGRLEELYEQLPQASASPGRAKRPGNAKWPELLLPMLREWLSTLKTMPPAQRAAGLLAADRLLEAAPGAGRIPGWPTKSQKSSELQELGAAFEMNPSTGDYYYINNWGKQARELDRNGAVGQMATIGSMALGSCNSASPNFFRQVIHDGEALLAKGLDAPTAAQVHFMVGDAYSDIVAIAGGEAGANGEYDPEEFQGEADSSHAKALQHYRAGLAVDNTSKNAKDAWRQAWGLSAGLLPSERYVCFGD
jgi:hypothetical protein